MLCCTRLLSLYALVLVSSRAAAILMTVTKADLTMIPLPVAWRPFMRAAEAALAAEARSKGAAEGGAADTPAQLQQLLSAAQQDDERMQELLQLLEQRKAEQVKQQSHCCYVGVCS